MKCTYDSLETLQYSYAKKKQDQKLVKKKKEIFSHIILKMAVVLKLPQVWVVVYCLDCQCLVNSQVNWFDGDMDTAVSPVE